ncbi:hypothetical protein [Flagellimonas algicola]|uniref:NHL repeat-containing protein n=1 Tax=Flagellimonas algicola TaxID=2583815 RepID=A0ABY2WH89_9FLAO|nr:hypothetical protein [Allomuricauda algicola]TMU50667.1 hypothetical protein FGG15_17860 [Allomuricauda algicola]
MKILETGNFWVTRSSNHKIGKVDRDTETVGTITGGARGYVDGGPVTAKFADPYGISVGSDGTLFTVDSDNHCVEGVDPEGMVETIVGVPGNNDGNGGFVEAQGTLPNFNSLSRCYMLETKSILRTSGNHAIEKITWKWSGPQQNFR